MSRRHPDPPRPWWEDPPSRPRAYTFRSRSCRQRIAQALGQGRRPADIARVERCAPEDIDGLLRDPSFQALVRHWEDVATLDPEARLARLTAQAMDLIELAVASGDLRVAMFVAAERRAGRHPARTVAAALVRRMESAAVRETPRPEAPRPSPPPPTATPANASRHPFAFCAPTLPTDAQAMHLAEAEAARVGTRLARARSFLVAKLAAECERAGTAPPGGAAAPVRVLGRALRRPSDDAIAAAIELDHRRDGFARGLTPPFQDTG